MPQPKELKSLEEAIALEILEAKAKWLELVCATLIPEPLQSLNTPGNLDQCRVWLKSRNAIIAEYPNRSAVFVKNKLIATFEPTLKEGHIHFNASVASVPVHVADPIHPPTAPDN